jgi:hypothetical protein
VDTTSGLDRLELILLAADDRCCGKHNKLIAIAKTP